MSLITKKYTYCY